MVTELFSPLKMLNFSHILISLDLELNTFYSSNSHIANLGNHLAARGWNRREYSGKIAF